MAEKGCTTQVSKLNCVSLALTDNQSLAITHITDSSPWPQNCYDLAKTAILKHFRKTLEPKV